MHSESVKETARRNRYIPFSTGEKLTLVCVGVRHLNGCGSRILCYHETSPPTCEELCQIIKSKTLSPS